MKRLLILLSLCSLAAVRSPKHAEQLAAAGQPMAGFRLRLTWQQPHTNFTFTVYTATNLRAPIASWPVLTNLTGTGTQTYTFPDLQRFFAVRWRNTTNGDTAFIK